MSSDLNEVLSVLDCVLHENEATYISIPITTGLRFLDWYKMEGKNIVSSEEYHALHYKQVIEQNISASADFVEHVRNTRGNAVIEPTKLVVKDWTQNDYHNFWIRIINRFIKEAFFMTGWHLSKGCTLEFLTAKRKGIPVYDVDSRPISTDEACTLLESTIDEYAKLGLETAFFSDVVSKLTSGLVTK
jgi:hypothetical protein